ncbi:MAG: Druantia anti-phage system protein DruA [Deltaproteobacteria bacterium]
MSNGMVIQGRLLSGDDIDIVREIIVSNPSWRRTRISQELCNRWGWFNHLGQPKDMACRSMLLKLEAKGYITLPARSAFPLNGLQHRSIPGINPDTTPIAASLRDLLPLSMEIVKGKDSLALFCHLLSRYHYLGYSVTVGESMKYIIRDKFGRPLSCVLFGSAAWKVACRDGYVGWTKECRERNLYLVTNNMRFLVLPWVTVAHLASHILGRIARRIRKDWVERYGHPVVLLETFVDTSRFRGTCYRAANWRYAGQTKGRSRNDRYNDLRVPVKDVYLYPLTPHFREILADERH